MMDEVVMVRGDEIIGTLQVAARGSCGDVCSPLCRWV